MRVKDLLETTRCEVRLHNGRNGNLVAKTPESLEKFGEVTVLHIDCRLDFGKDHYSAKTYLFVYGDSRDIEVCKETQKRERSE